jgi:hypothetical protein
MTYFYETSCTHNFSREPTQPRISERLTGDYGALEGKIIGRKKQNFKTNLPQSLLPATNPTMTVMELNPDLHCEAAVPVRLSYDTQFCS